MVILNKKVFHFSRAKFRAILRYFSLDIDAKTTGELAIISRPTVNKIFLEIRKIIAKYCEDNSIFKVGEIELDESYFGARRVRGKRGRGAHGKIPVFGMLKRGDKVYTQIVKNCSIAQLLPIIEEHATKDSTIFTDGLNWYRIFPHWAGKSMMDLSIMVINNITESSTATMNLLTEKITLME